MIIAAKKYGKRCSQCGKSASPHENDGFCHSCGEFFTEIASRWFNPKGFY